MEDIKTGISDKAQAATDAFIRNTLLVPVVSYSWSQAMRDAGYAPSTIDHQAKRVWGLVVVQQQVEKAIAVIKAKAVFSRVERQEWWTKMMASGKTDADKLRASELLGRSEADFTDNISNTVPDQSQTLTKDQQVEALRDQIRLLQDSESAGTAIAI